MPSHRPSSSPPLSRRLLLRLAARLQAAWIAKPPPDPADHEWETFDSRLRGLQAVRHRWRLAHDHRLRHVLPDLHREVHTALDDLGRVISRLQARLDEEPNGEEELSHGLTLDHWLAELQQLDDEFDERTVDWKASTLQVSTDQIGRASCRERV